MQKTLRNLINGFIFITILTAIFTFCGLGYLWYSGKPDLPYLKVLIPGILIEIAGIVFMYAKKGVQYLPEVIISKNVDSTIDFMKDFFNNASSITIVSNRVSWLVTNEELKKELHMKSLSGVRIEIITPKKLEEAFLEEMSGIEFFVTNEDIIPEARFTLINGDRGGCERLAIARGAYPEHEITIFDNSSGPQMISMAKDIIRKNKEKSDGARME